MPAFGNVKLNFTSTGFGLNEFHGKIARAANVDAYPCISIEKVSGFTTVKRRDWIGLDANWNKWWKNEIRKCMVQLTEFGMK